MSERNVSDAVTAEVLNRYKEICQHGLCEDCRYGLCPIPGMIRRAYERRVEAESAARVEEEAVRLGSAIRSKP